MSIIISSDENSNSSTTLGYLPSIDVSFSSGSKTVSNKISAKKTKDVFVCNVEESEDVDNRPIVLDSDAMFDEMCKVTERTDSGISTDLVSSGDSLQSRGSGSSNCSTRSKRRAGIFGKIEENVKKKEAKNVEKQLKKQKIAEEKATKQTETELNKMYKPGECIKHMTIEMHPKLLNAWYCEDIRREAAAIGARVSTSDNLCDEGLVMWSRDIQPTLVNRDGQMVLSAAQERCERALYVLHMKELVPLVASHSLSTHMRQVQSMAGTTVTLLVFGAKVYFKSEGRRKRNDKEKPITEIDMEMAFTDMLVSAGCDVALMSTPNELALFIVQFTKAIAEEPYKKAKRDLDQQAEFYMRGDNKKCVSVDKDGHGLSGLWQQMVAILPLSSLETARTICGKYKSPLDLYEALQSPEGVSEIADLRVSRAAVPGSKSRRLGPEFARKLKILFTEEDGNTLLD